MNLGIGLDWAQRVCPTVLIFNHRPKLQNQMQSILSIPQLILDDYPRRVDRSEETPERLEKFKTQAHRCLSDSTMSVIAAYHSSIQNTN